MTRAVLCVGFLALAHACSTVKVSPSKGSDVIARTMELGGAGGEFLGLSAGEKAENWTLGVHPVGEKLGSFACTPLGADGWTNKYGFVAIDLMAEGTLISSSDGINEKGLSVGCHTLRQSEYQKIESGKGNICWGDFVAWALGSFGTVKELRTGLASTNIVQPIPCKSGQKLHWAAFDAVGDSLVIEVLEGQLHLHNNTVGVLTNDPDFTWHLRNLNNYVNLSPSSPSQPADVVVQSEIGEVPTAVGHGFNLAGMPGDFSPPSRFVQLFYLRQYSKNMRPASEAEAVVTATGILNNVYIVKGTVADDPIAGDFNFEFTQFSVLKLPQALKFYYKTYDNNQWKMIDLTRVDFSKSSHKVIFDGTTGVKDITGDL